MSHGWLNRAVLLCFGLLGAFASPAAAGTVTLETDTTTFDVGCTCMVPSVPGELRYEIFHAVPGDTVDIAPGIDPQLDSGEILIDKNLTIQGQGADPGSTGTTILTVFNSRIFKIGSVTPASTVTIRDLMLAGGFAPSGTAGTGAAGGSGGAIHTNATVTVNRVRFAANRAGNGGSGVVGTNGTSGGDGGIGGPGGAGGALFNQVGGTLTVLNSLFDDNAAGNGGTGGKGGNGMGMFPAAGAGGTGGAGLDGGAIQNTGVLVVSNSTFYSNGSGQGGMGGAKGDVGLAPNGDGGPAGDGGAIHQGGAGSVTISNSTFADNVAALGGAGAGLGGTDGADGVGGGTYFFIQATVANSLYSQNTAAAANSANCAGSGTITSTGPNLSFPSGGCPGSFSNGDPQLGALGDNGGPTPTLALGPGSAAINQVPVGSPNCPGVDQRGVTRPQGPTCDIGAFELEMAPLPQPGGNPGGNPGQTKQTKKKCKKKKAKKKSVAAAKGCKKKKRKR